MTSLLAERSTKKTNYYYAATAVRYVVFRAANLTDANAKAKEYFQQLYNGRVYELVHMRPATHTEIVAHKEHTSEGIA